MKNHPVTANPIPAGYKDEVKHIYQVFNHFYHKDSELKCGCYLDKEAVSCIPSVKVFSHSE